MTIGLDSNTDITAIKKLQECFISFSELFADEIRAGKFKKDSKNFQWFVENDCNNISICCAKKIIDVYNTFIVELDLSFEDVIEICNVEKGEYWDKYFTLLVKYVKLKQRARDGYFCKHCKELVGLRCEQCGNPAIESELEEK